MKSIGAVATSIGTIRETVERSDPFETQLAAVGTIKLSAEEVKKYVKNTAGLMAIGVQQVTLHIYHPYFDREELESIPAPGPKFRFTECKTILRMRVSGKYDRYIASNEKNGRFPVTHFDKKSREHQSDEISATLNPCQNCLEQINYNGWSDLRSRHQRRKALRDFNLEQFYEDFQFIFRCLPTYTSDTFPNGNYPSDWARISQKIRRQADWICSCCQLDCNSDHGLLHVHHKSGNKGDVRPSNLEVVCAACHKARPFHKHMQIRPSTKNRLEQLRVSQALTRLCKKCEV